MDGDLYKIGDTLSIVLTGDAWKEEEYGVKEYLGGPVHAYVADSSPAGTYNVSFPNGKVWWIGAKTFEASILGAIPETREAVGFKSIYQQVTMPIKGDPTVTLPDGVTIDEAAFKLSEDLGEHMREVIDRSKSALDIQEGGGHYKSLKIQPVEYIHANSLSYLQGNVIKYITRYKDKNGEEDLKKAKHYIDLILEMEYGGKDAL